MPNALMKTTAKFKDELIQLVSFTVDNEQFGVDVMKVREIIRLPVITHVPSVPRYVEGVINLRGSVIPIISMRERFGLAEAETDGQTRIIVMDVGGDLMGFKVDAVSEVIRTTGNQIQPPPSMLSNCGDQQCITGVVNRTESMLVIVDPERMFSVAEMELL